MCSISGRNNQRVFFVCVHSSAFVSSIAYLAIIQLRTMLCLLILIINSINRNSSKNAIVQITLFAPY